jgi:hypothetical protein
VAADAVGLHDEAAMTPNDVLAGAATAASALLAVPAATYAAQCLFGSLPRRPRPPADDARLRMAVVVPAHDEAADWITAALARGALRHQYYRTFALDDIAAAHEATESMRNVGKVLVAID